MEYSKFGFITDTHYDCKYDCRKDDALSSLIDKTRQCYEWFKSIGCEFVVHGGDMFDRHRIYNFDMMRRVRDVFQEGGLKTYYIMGQHDLSGYNENTLPASSLGFLDAISDGALGLIDKEAGIGGYHFVASHVDMDPVKTVNEYNVAHDRPVVFVCHALLTDQREAFGTISITHFKNMCVSLVLSGDLHDGVAFQKCNGIQFYNPGALARDSKDMRMPKVGALQYDDEKGEFTLEEFCPKCRPCEEIFFWNEEEPKADKKHEEEKEGQSQKSDFIDDFCKFKSESKDIYELLERIGKANGIQKEVLELIKKHKDMKNVSQ